MPADENNTAPASSTPVEPPKIYFAACGVACDIFWWARREAAAEPPAPNPKPEVP